MEYHHVVSGDVAAAGDADDEHHPGDVGGEVQLTGLGVDVAGQDVVQHHVLDKVGFVELLVVILLDALQADGQHSGKLARSLVRTFHKNGIIVTSEFCGVHIFGAQAAEMIAEPTALMCAEMTVEETADMIHAHPSFSEAFMEACGDAMGRCIHLPKKR